MLKNSLVVLTNERVEANDFSMEYSCHYCENFVSQVVVIPNNGILQFICKGCLNILSEALDENMLKNFERNFERKRQITDKKKL